MHRYSDKSDCYMQHTYDDTHIHIFKNVLYSTDPKSGEPLARTLVGVDDVKMLEFGLNHRVCNVETTVNESETHVLDYRPNDATELWTLMRNVYAKWERLYEDNGRAYWPCRSQAADLVINGDVDSLRCLQPIRFVSGRHKLACSLLDLLSALTSNYFRRLLEVHMSGEYLLGISQQKVRKIECNAMNKALSFFGKFDPHKLDSGEKNPDVFPYSCGVKELMNSLSKIDSHKLPTNFLKKLFHYTISDVFTGHRDHVHMLLCHRFLAEDREHCENWIQFFLAVADSRLQKEDAQNRLIAEVKCWKRVYDRAERTKRTRASAGPTKRNRTEHATTGVGCSRTVNRANSANGGEGDRSDGDDDGDDDTGEDPIRVINGNALQSVGTTGALFVRI